jgi:hypothetical protein
MVAQSLTFVYAEEDGQADGGRFIASRNDESTALTIYRFAAAPATLALRIAVTYVWSSNLREPGTESEAIMSEFLRPRATPAANASTIDRRVAVRYPSELDAICEPAAAKTSAEPEMRWSAKVRDISTGGLGLWLGRRFERGTVLIVELPTVDEDSPRLMPVRVAHVTRAGPGQWIVGCAFVRRLSEDELQAALQQGKD